MPELDSSLTNVRHATTASLDQAGAVAAEVVATGDDDSNTLAGDASAGAGAEVPHPANINDKMQATMANRCGALT